MNTINKYNFLRMQDVLVFDQGQKLTDKWLADVGLSYTWKNNIFIFEKVKNNIFGFEKVKIGFSLCSFVCPGSNLRPMKTF